MSSGIAPLTEHPPWSTNVSRPIPWLEAENYLHVKTRSRRRSGSLILLSRREAIVRISAQNLEAGGGCTDCFSRLATLGFGTTESCKRRLDSNQTKWNSS